MPRLNAPPAMWAARGVCTPGWCGGTVYTLHAAAAVGGARVARAGPRFTTWGCRGCPPTAVVPQRERGALPGLAAAATTAPFGTVTTASSPITPRATDFSSWYHDVIGAADLVDAATPVRGCSIIKPHGFAVWELVRDALDRRIRDTGHVNAYFPLLIPAAFLAREAAHVAGFAKECAVVTHTRVQAEEVTVQAADRRGGGGGTTPSHHHHRIVIEPDPQSQLAEPYVIRPTSETVIWDAFRRWIRTHADLPLLLNQWANVVRWEMRTRPFLRTSEFLWQEGHTAHATEGEARLEAETMLSVYEEVCAHVLAIPVLKGAKSPSERFAGAVQTYTCEAIMQNGWALQSATSHFLGQNFARAFDVTFTTRTGASEHVWATSWGASTRLLGAVIMSHSDDTGLVLPPRIAPVQVVVVPIVKSGTGGGPDVMSVARQVCHDLQRGGVRVKLDMEVDHPPGGRYFEWERKGVPLRVEIGPKDVAAGVVTLKGRVEGQRRERVAVGAGLTAAVQVQLDGVHDMLLARRRAAMAATVTTAETYDDMRGRVEAGPTATDASDKAVGWAAPVFLQPWRDDAAMEARVKAETGYTVRCFVTMDEVRRHGLLSESGQVEAWDQGWKSGCPPPCFATGSPATHMALFARAF